MAIANNILMESDMLLDSDIGVYKVVEKEFSSNTDVFMPLFFNSLPLGILKTELLCMEDNNVMKVFMDNRYHGSSETLLTEIRDEYCEDIVNQSIFTKLLSLVRMYLDTEVISVTVMCRNKYEVEKIKKVRPTIKTILYNQMNVLLADKYDSWYFKDYNDVIKFKPKGKNIYLGNYNFNIKNGVINKRAGLLLSPVNVLKIASVHEPIEIYG